MMSPAREGRTREWVVDLRSHRVVRRPALVLNEHSEERMSSKDREKALHDLSPIEDVKGAINYLKHLDPIDELKEFMETAAEVLDPRESDIRAVRAQEDTRIETEED